MVLPGAEPFFLPGAERAVLLIHGLTGLPPEMRLLGEYLNRLGFTVLGVRLAGHGTSPEDLMRVTHGDWLDSARDGYAILADAAKSVAVVGHSMGALLALALAREKEIARAAIMAPPIFIAEEQGLSRLPPREKSWGHYTPRAHRRLPDVPEACRLAYSRLPLMAIHELLALIEETKPQLAEVACPLLIMHSHEDHTAAPRSAEYIYENVASAEKKIFWLEESGHMLPLDREREIVFREIGEFLCEVE